MLADFTQVRAAPTLNWTEDFAAWLHENDRMPKTIMAYLQDLRHFSRYFEQVNMQPFTPDQLNATDVKAYFKAQDADKSVAPNSRNRRLASLRVLIEWAVAMGILEYDPTVCVKRVAVELSPRDRSKAEMQALESVASTGSHLKRQTEKHTLLGLRDQIVWDLFRDAGLRIHELAGLDVDDLDLEACEIHVMGKGAKKAKVIIPSTLVKALASWVDRKPISAEGALITDWNGKRISTSQIRRRLYLIGQAAGVDVKPEAHVRLFPVGCDARPG
jgi:integrase/recombinase XerC